MGMAGQGLLSTGGQRPLRGSDLGQAGGGDWSETACLAEQGHGQRWDTHLGDQLMTNLFPSSLWNRAVQDAKKGVKEKRDPVMHDRRM